MSPSTIDVINVPNELGDTNNQSLLNQSTMNVDKHTMLFDDAKHRQMR